MAVLGPPKNTKGERTVRMWLTRNGFKFELHPLVKGTRRADFLVNDVYLFIDGRFWHDPEHTTKTMSKYWRDKIRKNFERDRDTEAWMNENGKKFIRIWDSDLKNPKRWKAKLLKALGKE